MNQKLVAVLGSYVRAAVAAALALYLAGETNLKTLALAALTGAAGIAKHLGLTKIEKGLESALGAAGTIATLCYTEANNTENNAGYRDKPIKPNLADITKVSLITGLTKMFPQSIVNKIIGSNNKMSLQFNN